MFFRLKNKLGFLSSFIYQNCLIIYLTFLFIFYYSGIPEQILVSNRKLGLNLYGRGFSYLRLCSNCIKIEILSDFLRFFLLFWK